MVSALLISACIMDICSAQERPAQNRDCESLIMGMATKEMRFAMMADMILAAAHRSVIGQYDLQSLLLPFPFQMVIILHIASHQALLLRVKQNRW